MTERRFSPEELGDAFGPEGAEALETSRLLHEAIDASGPGPVGRGASFGPAAGPSDGFADRVMAALADEPAPAPAGFMLPIRRRGLLRGLWSSVRQAMVATGGAGRPAFGRAVALAYVLVVAVAGASITGAASFGAAGALGLLDSTSSPTVPPASIAPGPTNPAPTPAPTESLPVTPAPSVSPDASPPAPSPSESPDESDDHGSGAEPSDDHGGNSGPGGGDDGGSGSGSGSDDETPEPTRTPRPSETPH